MLKRYLLGGDAPHMAGDGLGLVLTPSTFKRSLPLETERRKPSTACQGSGETTSGTTSPQDAVHLPRAPYDGTKAPRCSKATDLAVTPPLPSPSPETTPLHAPQLKLPDEREVTNVTKNLSEKMASWQDFEIPRELNEIDEDMPQEIKSIIRESFDGHRAMQISTSQSTFGDDVVAQSSGHLPKDHSVLRAESSAMTSLGSLASSLGTESTEWKKSNFSMSQESITTTGSETQDANLLQPPEVTGISLASPQHLQSNIKQDRAYSSTSSPVPAITRIEARFHEAKDRTSKSRGLYSLFNRRRMKTAASTTPAPKPPPPTCECTSCFDDIPHRDAVDGLPCRHRYCHSCFAQLVLTSISNEHAFPPKCCLIEIPKTVMRKYLPPVELFKFDQKSLEYTVPLADRYYCVSPECARWIDTRIAKRTNGALECPHCETQLCTVCRGPQHPGNQDCPQDFSLDATLQEAEQAGWRRCYNCRAIVELNTGCRHITCKCRAEFCYTCGAVWRTCQCTEADQRRREEELRASRIKREADARAEEEEVRRAIAAVEEAERQLREEREAEEAREQARLQREAEELAQREFERVERINERYAELRAILDHVGLQQQEAIEKRHSTQEEANDRLQEDFDEMVSKQEAEIKSAQDAKVAETYKMIKQLQKKHSASVMETIQRHRRDQDALLPNAIEDSSGIQNMVKAAVLEALMPLQELERTTLKQQQAREIEKWKLRSERTRRINTTIKIKQMHFEEEEKLAVKIDTFNRQQEAELQWIGVLHAERVGMLVEDERRQIVSGTDIREKADKAGVEREKRCSEGPPITPAVPGAFEQ